MHARLFFGLVQFTEKNLKITSFTSSHQTMLMYFLLFLSIYFFLMVLPAVLLCME